MDLRTYYLKYRPQKLADLDLPQISQELLKVVKSKKVPHAFLFSGPKGTGKTSAARILAKAINCARPLGSGEPCNRCEFCQGIIQGTLLDLIEIDAASNRGIDDIRSLREKIRLSPAKARFKVYIIDEVHMLTTEAFNALLKTLEEPPAHAIFILCTTEPEKLPETIISRCLRFNFRKARPEEIIKGPLVRAVKGEGLTVEKGVLEAIAKTADGSFRDAHKILEQLTFGSKKITLKQTQNFLGQVEELSPQPLLKLLGEREVKGALKEIDRVVEAGGDLNVFAERFLEQLRLGLLSKIGLDEIEPVKEVNYLSYEQLKFLIKLISQAVLELKNAPIPQLPLELAVVEFCAGGETNSLPAQEEKREEKINPNPKDPKENFNNKIKQIEAKWNEILTQIKPLNHSIEALLKASRPLKIEGEVLTLEVFYKFHKERLETEKCRAIIEEVMEQTLGTPLKLRCILGEKPLPKKQTEDFASADDSGIIELANQIFNNGSNKN